MICETLSWKRRFYCLVLKCCVTCLTDCHVTCQSNLFSSCGCRWSEGCGSRRSCWSGLVWCLRSLQQLGPHHRLLFVILQALLTSHTLIYFHIRAKYLRYVAFTHSAGTDDTLVKYSESVLFPLFPYKVSCGKEKDVKMDKIPLRILINTVLELPS